jgi:hypothetical protein
MNDEFYEAALVYDCFSDEDDAKQFIYEYADKRLSKCFIAIFDPDVSKSQMTREIIEAVKCMGSSEGEC